MSLFVRGISAPRYSCGHKDIFKLVTDQVRMQACNTQTKVPVEVKIFNIYNINSLKKYIIKIFERKIFQWNTFLFFFQTRNQYYFGGGKGIENSSSLRPDAWN